MPLSVQLVFFGCRNASNDFYYRSEWEGFHERGICKFYWAASRDQPSKRYVQDLIQENSSEVWQFIQDKNANVYISGSSGLMPKGVRLALAKIYQKHEGLDEQEACKRVDELEKAGRLLEETWS